MPHAEESFGDVIRAAGGLVWRDSPDGKGKELAVILRSRYEKDGEGWTLPKGKLDPAKGDKTWEGAATREVKEETGCEVEVKGFVGCNSYIEKKKNKPKVVLYWNMNVTSAAGIKDPGEVKEVRWMSPQEAIEKLHYPGERALVWASTDELDSLAVPAFQIKRRWFRSTSHNRLVSSLPGYYFELEHLASLTRKPDGRDSSWAKVARHLLDESRKALEEKNGDLAWKCFLAAQRIELFGLGEWKPEALQARARSILTEANQKLDDWRKKTVVDLLAQKPAPEPDAVVPKANITVTEAFEASLILHEHYSNVQHRVRFHRGLIGALALIALIAVAVWAGVVLPLLGIDSNGAKLIPSVILFGILGASFSGILSLSTGVSRARIPEQLATIAITLARQVAGILSALAAYFLLSSGLLNLKVEVSPQLILAVCFAAGFSERLVVRAVETLSQR